MIRHRPGALVPILLGVLAVPALAQEASLVVTLGKDTVAVERFTRTAGKLSGEMVSRLGAAGLRLQYEVTLGSDGRPTTIVYRPRILASTPPPPNLAREIRLTLVGDSARREAVFADSTNTRMVAAAHGVPFQYPAFGLLEVAFSELRKSRATTAAMAAVGTGGGNPGTLTFTVGAGDTIRVASGGGFVTVYRADREGRVLSVDASGTTQKLMAQRGTGLDFEAIAGRMNPIGPLSARGTASGSFMQSVVFVNYGRPQVRGRTVWGGLLVPPDTVWRLGANEATHLATSRELSFGGVVVPPGLYTLWFFNKGGAPELVINKQVGQWGTSYDAAQDLGRVPVQMAATPQHVEDFTITIRNSGPGRGALDFAWGSQQATATFTVR